MHKIMVMLLGLAAAAFMFYFPFFWCRAAEQDEKDFGLAMPKDLDSYCLSLICAAFALAFTLVPLTMVSAFWPDKWGGAGPRYVPFLRAIDFLGGGLAAAIIEEVFFRGFLQTIIVKRIGAFLGIILTALIFAASHLIVMPGWLRFATFFPGLVMGILRHYCKSIMPSVLYHAICNIWAVWYAPG